MTPIEWLLSDDTGTSSRAILAALTESHTTRDFAHHPPADRGDFGRCHRLLQHFPEWRARLNEVAVRWPVWLPVVQAWEELEALYEDMYAAKSRVELNTQLRNLNEQGRKLARGRST